MEARIKRMLAEARERAEKEMPERNEFPAIEIKEEWTENEKTSYVKIRVIPPPQGIDDYEILRGIEVLVGNNQTPYLCSRLMAAGTKQQIMDKLASDEFFHEIVEAIPKMERSLWV